MSVSIVASDFLGMQGRKTAVWVLSASAVEDDDDDDERTKVEIEPVAELELTADTGGETAGAVVVDSMAVGADPVGSGATAAVKSWVS